MLRLLAPLSAALALASPAAAAPRPPMVLPGEAGASSAGGWIVGARPTDAAARIASRHRAHVLVPGAYAVDRDRARPLARALRRAGLLTFAEPDRPARLRQERAVPDDPLSPQARWRDHVVDPALVPPPVTASSPRLALIDSKADASHPELMHDGFSAASGGALLDFHGTATTAVASAPVNGQGFVGVWPGMRVLNVPLPHRIRCSDSTRGIRRALEARAAVINMSYGSPRPCYAEFLAIQRATARGVTVVAAAGNEFGAGNPMEFPASLPHVVTVAASTPQGTSAFFSNENAAIDLAAPGVTILTAVPVAYDTDGTADGYMNVDGTSFAAPMVAAAAAWLRAARPDLSFDQIAQVLRLSARDLPPERYDPATGFGQLDVRAALSREATPRDPREPNEDIPFVNGSAFGRVEQPVYDGVASTLFALLDVYEDPGDVYRIRVPARTSVRVTVRPRFGDPDLAVFGAQAQTVGDRSRRVGRSARRGVRSETVRVRNRARVWRSYYVWVYAPAGRRGLDAGYTLSVRKG